MMSEGPFTNGDSKTGKIGAVIGELYQKRLGHEYYGWPDRILSRSYEHKVW